MRLGRFLISSASLILKVRNLQTRKGKGLFWHNCYSCYSFSSLNFIIWYLKVTYWKHICKFLLQKLTIFFSVTEGNWTFGLGTMLLLTMKHYAGTLMQISNAVLVSQSISHVIYFLGFNWLLIFPWKNRMEKHCFYFKIKDYWGVSFYWAWQSWTCMPVLDDYWDWGFKKF